MIIFTNSGDSYLINSPGNYDLAMLGGNDTLTIQGGTTIYAFMGEGDDLVTIKAGAGSVDAYGESGSDRFDIWTIASANGGGDNDLFNIRGGYGHSLTGGQGDDRFNFYAGVTNTFLDGGDGNDDFYGYHQVISGNIYGWNGNDYFVGFANLDGQVVNLRGGAGNDVYRADPDAPANFVENADEGTDSVQVARGDSFTLPDNIENITVSGFSGSTLDSAVLTGNAGNNTITGHANVEVIYGADGNDKLFGKGGDDFLYGGDGNDTLDGGTGADYIQGDAGNDTINGREADDEMIGGTGDDTYYVDSAGDVVTENGGEGMDTVRTSVNITMSAHVEKVILSGTANLQVTGNDQDNNMVGNSGNNYLDGWNGNDTINGGAGNDQLMGWSGNDTMLGGDGDDLLFGEADNDTLNGGAGNDTLAGSHGVDTLTGGDGQDRFVYYSVSDSAAGAADLITDFSSVQGTDILDLSYIDANTNMDGDQAFVINTTGAPAGVAGDLWYTFDNEAGQLVWHGDVNGDSVADFELRVTTGPDLFSMYFSDIIV